MQRTKWWWILAAASLLFLSGCARFRPEPLYIKFPEPPHLTFQLCWSDTEGAAMVCLPQADGAALAKWMDKVRAFEAARERLQRE